MRRLVLLTALLCALHAPAHAASYWDIAPWPTHWWAGWWQDWGSQSGEEGGGNADTGAAESGETGDGGEL